jgi:tetratricopeptide (TPR) repeat protein
MSSPSSRVVRAAIVPLALVLLACAQGCADMVTFAGNNRAAGVAAYNEGRYTDAAGSFRSAIRQDPRDYESQYWLGMSYLKLGNYQSSIAAFRSCLDTRKVTLAGKADETIQAKALDGLAHAIVSSDEGDVEIDQVEQRARTAGGAKSAQEFFLLAKVYRYRKLPDMALDYYNRACLQDNQNFTYLKEYGLYLEQLQQRAQAETALRQAYAIKDDDAEVNAALQRQGVVPGLALKNKSDLAKPMLPKGPLPEPDWDKVKQGLGLGSGSPSTGSPANAAPASSAKPASGTVAAPRD